jgi:hypothetical protein
VICRMLWAPSGNVMTIPQPGEWDTPTFRAFIADLLAEGARCNPDDPPPLVEWEHDG